jgi:hypothetical protein
VAEAVSQAIIIAEAGSWLGFKLDELGGRTLGAVHGLYVDAEDGEPAWVIARIGRRRRARLVVVPALNCAGAGGRVWVAHEGGSVRSAPTVDPTRPLLREHELAICAHYGIGERIGRAAAVLARPEGAVTSKPRAQ